MVSEDGATNFKHKKYSVEKPPGLGRRTFKSVMDQLDAMTLPHERKAFSDANVEANVSEQDESRAKKKLSSRS